MSGGKIAGFVVSGIFIFFGVLFLWSAFAPEAADRQWGRLLTGVILVLIGMGIILLIRMRDPQKITYIQQVEVTGDRKIEELKCKNCGSPLDEKNLKVLDAAVTVTCPACGSVYELKEEPKW